MFIAAVIELNIRNNALLKPLGAMPSFTHKSIIILVVTLALDTIAQLYCLGFHDTHHLKFLKVVHERGPKLP